MNTIKIKTKGKDQILNIPDKYKLSDDEVYLKKIGNTLVIFPKNNPWEVLFNSLYKFSEDFMNERNQPDFF